MIEMCAGIALWFGLLWLIGTILQAITGTTDEELEQYKGDPPEGWGAQGPMGY